jgi:hypothetical protein
MVSKVAVLIGSLQLLRSWLIDDERVLITAVALLGGASLDHLEGTHAKHQEPRGSAGHNEIKIDPVEGIAMPVRSSNVAGFVYLAPSPNLQIT